MSSESSSATRAICRVASVILLLYAAGIASAQSQVSEAAPLDEVVIRPERGAAIAKRADQRKGDHRSDAGKHQCRKCRGLPAPCAQCCDTNLARGSNQIQIRGLGSNVGNVGTVAVTMTASSHRTGYRPAGLRRARPGAVRRRARRGAARPPRARRTARALSGRHQHHFQAPCPRQIPGGVFRKLVRHRSWKRQQW